MAQFVTYKFKIHVELGKNLYQYIRMPQLLMTGEPFGFSLPAVDLTRQVPPIGQEQVTNFILISQAKMRIIALLQLLLYNLPIT